MTEAPAPASTCLRCGHPLRAGARFCPNCGEPVAVPTPAEAERWRRLASAAPAPLADKMRMAGPLGGRRTVTSLFADVAGSTSIAERLDAEDWTSIMNEAFDVMAQAIYHYEGTVARLLGDGLLAFFGAPVAHEDDHERAIRAGLDMVRDVAIFADRVRSSVGVDFRIRGESTQDPLWWGT